MPVLRAQGPRTGRPGSLGSWNGTLVLSWGQSPGKSGSRIPHALVLRDLGRSGSCVHRGGPRTAPRFPQDPGSEGKLSRRENPRPAMPFLEWRAPSVRALGPRVPVEDSGVQGCLSTSSRWDGESGGAPEWLEVPLYPGVLCHGVSRAALGVWELPFPWRTSEESGLC